MPGDASVHAPGDVSPPSAVLENVTWVTVSGSSGLVLVPVETPRLQGQGALFSRGNCRSAEVFQQNRTTDTGVVTAPHHSWGVASDPA